MQTYRTDPPDTADGRAIPPRTGAIPAAATITHDDDDLFARPPRSALKPSQQLTRITCRVCERTAMVPIGHPALLCHECMADLDMTRGYVARGTDAVLSRMDQALAEWREMLDFSPAKDAWTKVEAAMIAVAEKRATQAALDATWAKRKAEGGALAELLIAYECYAATTDQCGVELNRWHRAQAEINAAWLATDI